MNMRKIKKIIVCFLETYKNQDITVKATLWYTVYNVLINGISFLTVPIYARIQTPEEYGKYNVFQSWSSILLIFGSLYLDSGVFANGMVRYKDKRDDYLSSMYGITGIATAIFGLIFVIIYPFVKEYVGIDITLIIIIFISNYFSIIIRLWGEKQKYELKYKRYTLVMAIYILLQNILGIVLVCFLQPKSKYRILAIVFTNILIGGYFFIENIKKRKKLYNTSYIEFAIKFNLALLPHYFSYTIFNQIDRIMIERLCGTSSVAIYSLAYSIGTIASTIANAMSASMTPWIYEMLRMKKYDKINDKIIFMGYLLGIITVMISLISPEIIQIIGTNTYTESRDIIPVICLGYFIYFLVATCGITLFYYEDKRKIVFGSSITAILNIVLNTIFIRMFGYKAAAYTTFVCYLVYLLVNLHFAQRLVLNQGGKKIYKTKNILTLVLVVGGICLAVVALIDYMILRYTMFFIGSMITLFYYYRRKKNEGSGIING